jgi:ribA/ribD-fused uncharacterized protein
MSDMENQIKEFKGQNFFLSNFFPHKIFYKGFEFASGEHLFNALKTLNREEAIHVMDASTPGEAKHRGRRVTLRENWDDVERFTAMRNTVGAKFISGGPLATYLVNTGDSFLIEGNTWHDNVWGDCICGRPSCQTQGQNHLGLLLMELRTDLQKWIK